MTAAVHASALEQDIDLLEQGLETLVGQRGVKSGGQVFHAGAASAVS